MKHLIVGLIILVASHSVASQPWTKEELEKQAQAEAITRSVRVKTFRALDLLTARGYSNKDAVVIVLKICKTNPTCKKAVLESKQWRGIRRLAPV